MVRHVKCLLIIAGTDPVSGAGATADAAVAADLGLHPTVAITAVTSQNTSGLRACSPVPAAVVRSQIEAVLADLTVAAVKIGLTPNLAIENAIADALASLDVPVVLDPVLHNGQDGSRMGAGTLRLWGCATVVTPNIPEAEVLTGLRARTREQIEATAAALLETGATNILLKGGHMPELGGDLLHNGVPLWLPYAAPLPARAVHGTGCHLSTAIAAGLASDRSDVRAAIESARAYLGSLQVVTARGPAGIFAHVRQPS
jgi:hydroxymethylpyrimidine/phosphomethylpyrimidine kinase